MSTTTSTPADAGVTGKPVYDPHDQAVANRINGYIARANADSSMKKSTIAEKLDWCWSTNIKDRESDSSDTVGRDADYYFAARHTIAADKSAYSKYFHKGVGAAAITVYNGLKVITRAVGADKIMRTDPDKPNAPPGGFAWENRGANDGIADRGQDVSDVIPHMPAP